MLVNGLRLLLAAEMSTEVIRSGTVLFGLADVLGLG